MRQIVGRIPSVIDGFHTDPLHYTENEIEYDYDDQFDRRYNERRKRQILMALEIRHDGHGQHAHGNAEERKKEEGVRDGSAADEPTAAQHHHIHQRQNHIHNKYGYFDVRLKIHVLTAIPPIQSSSRSIDDTSYDNKIFL